MAPISPKRRKLDHTSADAEVDMSDAESQTSQNPPEEVPERAQLRQTQPNAKKAQEGDSAIYDGGLYKSSLFKLQVDELLNEVRPNYEKKLRGVDDALRTLKGTIESIEDRNAITITEATKKTSILLGIKIPFPDPQPDPNAAYKLAYAKPSSINVVGSYVLKTMVKSDAIPSIDMIVVMPASIFQEKDFLNYRYFYKRAFYLASIASELRRKLPNEFSIDFQYLNGNSLHPVLVAKPWTEKSKLAAAFEIRIIPAAPKGFFQESKLRPSKNCIRAKEASDTEASTQSPTPFYNASIRADCNYEPYLTLLNSTNKHSTAFRDACVLGRVWLRQRGFSSDIIQGGFGAFEWSALAALLLKGGGPKGRNLLSSGYSSYQMFKAIIQFLSGNDLSTNPFLYEADDFVASKSSSPMVYDGPRGQNVFYKMTPWSYRLLREEARASLGMLNDTTSDQFDSTFIVRTSQTLQRYDCLLRLKCSEAASKSLSLDHTTPTLAVGNKIYETLREGLMDRVKIINMQMPDTPSWSVKGHPPSHIEQALVVAVVFDPKNIDRLVDHGPTAEDKKKAAKFQKFWGKKAELRRFKDGSILESLVWSPGSAYVVFQEIVTYLLKLHIEPTIDQSFDFIGDGFSKMLPGAGTSSKSFSALREAYDLLERQIRELENLPLQLRQLSAISSQLRYASLEPCSFSPQKPLKTPADVMIQFEGSGRWPDDIVAIQRTKIAFLLQIASLLTELEGSTRTRLGIENEGSTILNCAFLDIIYASGAVFRLRIQCDREQYLLEERIKDKATENHTREVAVAAMAIYKRSYVQLPLLTQSIFTHCTRFPLLSSTIRLVKLWFDRHMLLGHISEELIELLVAHVFLHPYPWQAPSSVMTGFLRTLLFISRWDWREVPLIVDFGGTMTSAEIDSINTRLEAWRKIDPGMNRTTLVAASSHDTTGTSFTDKGPSKMIAARMTALARSACKLVKEQGIELDHRLLFTPSTADYNFVIHISPAFSPDTIRKENAANKYKNLEIQSEMSIDLVGFEPVREFLAELERTYAECAVFFYGANIGSVIGGLWNPQAVAARALKLSLGYAPKVVKGKEKDEDEKKIELDKQVILSEIARLGGDMVKKIEVR